MVQLADHQGEAARWGECEDVGPPHCQVLAGHESPLHGQRLGAEVHGQLLSGHQEHEDDGHLSPVSGWDALGYEEGCLLRSGQCRVSSHGAD